MNAIGIIEAQGLPAAIEAADVMVKSANIELIGYEDAKGASAVAVKITGDIGAVNAALDAAKAALPNVTGFESAVSLARPSEDIESLIYTDSTVGLETKKSAPAKKSSASSSRKSTANSDSK